MLKGITVCQYCGCLTAEELFVQHCQVLHPGLSGDDEHVAHFVESCQTVRNYRAFEETIDPPLSPTPTDAMK